MTKEEQIERYFLCEIQKIDGIMHHKVYDRLTGEHFMIEDTKVNDEFINTMILKKDMCAYKPTPTER